MDVAKWRGRLTGRCTGNNNVIIVWDDVYCTDAASTNSTTKQRTVVDLATAEQLLEPRAVPLDAAATWADIAAGHDPAFVEAVRTGRPLGLAQSQGFTWSPAFADALCRIWNGHIAACRMALGAGTVLHPVSGAHHAGFARGSGFCTFNYLVGAARALLTDGLKRVAIVDLDAHPGDGTFELARRDRPRRTATGRLLARPETDPRASAIALFDIAGGRWCDTGDEDGVEYLVARDAEEYRSALDRLPGFLDRVRPQLVQYQAGMDPFEDDGVGGIDGVNEAFLGERDRFVIAEIRSRGIPLVVNLAGGYVRGVSERLHVNTVRAMSAWAGSR